jgi:hypothetical protein
MSAPNWTLLEKLRVVVEAARRGSEKLDELLREEGLTRPEYEAFRQETRNIFARARKSGVRGR